MKKALLIIVVLFAGFKSDAHHIIGGEMFYTYIGKGSKPNTSRYLITLKIFRDQNVPPNTAPMPGAVYIGIFNNDTQQEFPGPYPYYLVPKKTEFMVPVNAFPPCMSNPPKLNYHVGIFELTVELPDNVSGYTASYQTCCRVDDLQNVDTFEPGSTFSCSIPAAKYMDNSPQFATTIDVICANQPFQLKYNAIDVDNDSLTYQFTAAFDGGFFKSDTLINPSPPPYTSLDYSNGYAAGNPLGPNATINSATGIISGIAPSLGKYVICVKVMSYRKGVLINEHQKDFIVNVSDCDFAGVQLNPKPVVCDSFNVAFKNDNTSILNKTFYWDFGDPKSGAANTSTLSNPTHVFTDTGAFIYKLVVNRGQQCADSTTQNLKIYPGFYPSFTVDGKCINSSIFFTDKTTTNYGTVNNWSWNFGDPTSTTDTSSQKDPAYIYTQAGNYSVQLKVGNTKGCEKTFSQVIPIKLHPDLSLNNDTLMCNIDTLQLTALGQGNISWTPNYNINNIHSFTPLISPKAPTTYYATLVESRGCIATDSVFVNVVSKVTLNMKPDTTICLTDTAIINTTSDGLHYLWSPSATIINDTAKNVQVIPLKNTTYHVVASIGKCNTAGNINIRTVPYPKAKASVDTTLCFPASVQLHASGGSIYNWIPPVFLNNSKIADPISSPEQSVMYVAQVNDVLGCPKPVYDTVIVNVQKIVADAGPRDTSIVVNQPLQLNGTGGQFYNWSPPNGLDNSNISNPVALLSKDQQYILKVSSAAGCSATDTINITVYQVKPDLFVPNAFTPNGDGKNDLFRPILIGMRSLNFFRVYNRLGQLVFSTTTQKDGWDGTFRGQPQDAGVFVWMAEGVDYLGKTIFKKGSVMLIR